MAFDPDKYLAEKSGQAFDPDKYLAAKGLSPTPPAQEKPFISIDTKGGLIKGLPNRLAELPSKIGESVKEIPGAMMKAAHTLNQPVARVLDYPGGLIRTAAAGAVSPLVGNQVVSSDDIENALLGKAPLTSEYLERVGVPEMGKIPVSNAMEKVGVPEGWRLPDITGRGLVGFAGDILSGEGGGAISSSLAKKGGEAMYKSGLKKIDQVVARYGKDPVSDLLMKHRITGNAQQIFDQMDELGQSLLAGRDDILQRATAAGSEVDMNRSMSHAQAFVDRLRKEDNPELEGAINIMQKRINKFRARQAQEPETILRTLPTSELKHGDYREILGYRPKQEELLSLPAPKFATEGKPMPPALAYEAPNEKLAIQTPSSTTKPLTELRDIDPKKPFDRLKVSGPEPESVPVLEKGNEIWPEQQDKVLSFPVGNKYETKYVPNSTMGLVQNPAEIVYGREIPAQYVPGKPVTVIDESERIPGPNPMQTTAWKTNSANNVGKKGYQELAQSPMGKSFDKKLASGLRQGTEEAVGRELGPEEQALLNQKNADLGKILTSKERALLDAEQEANKNAFTSVDGMILGFLKDHPWMLATKKAADLMKLTGNRTRGGLLLQDLSKAPYPNSIVRQGLIDAER